jgi:hypothetical protein
MKLQDAALNLFKSSHSEALPHWPQAFATPVEATTGELLIGVCFGFESFRVLDVNGSFIKALFVRLLL